MRRVLTTLAYWAVGLIVYPVRIGADWVERHGQPDDPIDPTWERHGKLMRARHRHCAGCSRIVVVGEDGRWAEVDGNVRNLVCAESIEGDRLVWARWHYVEGEQQQVWPEEPA